MINNSNSFWIAFIMLSALSLTGCGPNYVYENTLECSEQGWAFQDSLESVFEIKDSNAIYNLHLLIEHSAEFSYQNFYTQIHTSFPNGERISEQLSLELAGTGGVWLGDCNSTFCQLDIPIQQGVFFNQIGEYRIAIQQFSRQDPLKGILNITFGLEEAGEKR